MSEEYTLMQYESEQLRNDILYWRKIATEAMEKSQTAVQLQKDVETLTKLSESLKAENEEYRRTNERIWETTKVWIREDSDIISKQASQIKYLAAKIKVLEKNEEE
jgi:hypothetical protein